MGSYLYVSLHIPYTSLHRPYTENVKRLTGLTVMPILLSDNIILFRRKKEK